MTCTVERTTVFYKTRDKIDKGHIFFRQVKAFIFLGCYSVKHLELVQLMKFLVSAGLFLMGYLFFVFTSIYSSFLVCDLPVALLLHVCFLEYIYY